MAEQQSMSVVLDAAVPCPTIGDLPDALLGRVLALAGGESWLSMVLTSRRWHRVLLEEAPIAWRWDLVPSKAPAADFEAAIASRVSLLQRIGKRIQHARMHNLQPATDWLQRSGWQPAGLLALLNPAAMRSVDLCWNPSLPVPAVQLVGSFSQLTSLSLSCADELPAASALGQLRQLASFDAAERRISAELVEAVCSLSGLTSLSLSAVEMLDSQAEALLPGLTALGRLRVLNLKEQGRAAGTLQPPPPALFSNLEEFEYFSLNADGDGSFQVRI
ncbi:hypothetical protein ABPG75_000193 [Micractinium tetrahymenae]